VVCFGYFILYLNQVFFKRSKQWKKLLRKEDIHQLKKKSQSAYDRKVKKIEKWYNHLLKCREKEIINPNTKQETKRKPLKELDYYIKLLKQFKGD